jgi:hypothetical protein
LIPPRFLHRPVSNIVEISPFPCSSLFKDERHIIAFKILGNDLRFKRIKQVVQLESDLTSGIVFIEDEADIVALDFDCSFVLPDLPVAREFEY